LCGGRDLGHELLLHDAPSFHSRHTDRENVEVR
jgi:hypothetical protein